MDATEQLPSLPRRCQFWISNKRRFCANSRLPDSLFCGNHNPSSQEQRVPCPIDPSHSVVQGKLDSHVRKCPLRKQIQKLESQPFYQKGINCSRGDDGDGFISSEAKRDELFRLTATEFLDLIENIKSLHSLLQKRIDNLRESYILPKACTTWLEGRGGEEGHRLPFQEKHALQQASILGNVEAFGLLWKPSEGLGDGDGGDGSCADVGKVEAVVEFGAGRGYLTQMLADCYGIKRVFLVERRSYKLKADRSLRQKESVALERLRIDIEDLNLNGIESLRGLPYLAIGKHLCGPAIDLTLRCCLSKEHNNEALIQSCHISQPRGLALATCCHHLCQWDQFINRTYFSKIGIKKEDFHAITWFSSWAVDGDHSVELPNTKCQGQPPSGTRNSSINVKGIEATVKHMSSGEKALLGFICKEVIDMGRLLWLKEHGLDADLVKYVPPNISPENHLLVAKCTKHV